MKLQHARQAMGHFLPLYGKKTTFQLQRYDELIRKFRQQYNSEFCYVASASGRVEIVGNHTDHNGGKVLACTIDKDIIAAFLPRKGKVHMEGRNYRDIDFPLSQIYSLQSGSVGMVKGVLAGLAKRGWKVGGFSAMLHSTLQSGSGMSSSAAFQMLVACIQNFLYNDGKIPLQHLAEAGQYAENVYFRKPSGLLDQAVVAAGGLVEVDFANQLCVTPLQCALPLQMIVVNTGKSHSSLTQHYAAIPSDMKKVAALFGRQQLSQVPQQQFEANFAQVQHKVGAIAAGRAKHFFEENARVQQFVQALQVADKSKLLQLANQSGQSSRDNLQNCHVDEDFSIAQAVDFANSICPCAARVHGGGFRGTVLVLSEKQHANLLQQKLAERYGQDNVHMPNLRSVGAVVL